MSRVRRHSLLMAGLLLAVSPLGAAGQMAAPLQPPPQPSVQGTPDNGARRTIAAWRLAENETITLDGRLDEPVWAQAVPAGQFVQIDPDNGQPATESTEVHIAFDRDSLYLGVTCHDSDPEGWIGHQMRRDALLGSDDRFMLVIDTFLDGRSGYLFETNPSGLMGDVLLGTNGANREWNGIWDLRVRRSEIGWTVEIKIPFRTMNFDPGIDTWGINFQRTVRRKNEDSIWMGWARNQGIRRMSNTGLVTGISGVSQGRGLDIKPYGVLTSQASPGRANAATENKASAGIDLFYNPTPLLRANLTVNTDFAQTEVDQRQVNLTRFSLFFPERRDFFLDGATFLDFASDIGTSRGDFFLNFIRGSGATGPVGEERIIPFFSRRIGLSTDATSQKIDFGTKLTGQLGQQDVGFLHVRTGEERGFVSEDFTVGRVKRRLFSQSYIGAMYTRRAGGADAADVAQTAGVDMLLSTSRFRGSENLGVNAWFLHTARPDISKGNSAFGAMIDYPNDLWLGRVKVSEVQENFDPAVGFVRRSSYRRYAPELQFSPRLPAWPNVRQVAVLGQMDLYTDLRNELLSRDIRLTPISIDFQTQDALAISVSRQRERLDAPFDIGDEVTLPMGGTYDFTRYRLLFQSANRRKIMVDTLFEGGGFFSGTRTEQAVEVSVRPRPGLILAVTAERNTVDLPEGNVTTRLYRFNAETPFSPFMALAHNIQYDSQSRVLGWQSRFRWILTPGSDLYVVYTHNWMDDSRFDRFSTLDKRLASKVLYTYRF